MITSSPAILGYALDNIEGKIAALRALGFADPVKMITSSPAILGYAPERIDVVGTIVMGLDDPRPAQFNRLISKPRKVIEFVAEARPTSAAQLGPLITAGRAQ